MRNTNKKGFTIVELVIVIAVIAILAAVLIPTFAGIIDRANQSADKQAVTNMNKLLAMNEKADDVDGVVEILIKEGYKGDLSTYFADYSLAWVESENAIVLVRENKVVYPTHIAENASYKIINPMATDSEALVGGLTDGKVVFVGGDIATDKISIDAAGEYEINLNGNTVALDNRAEAYNEGSKLVISNGVIESASTGCSVYSNNGGYVELNNVQVYGASGANTVQCYGGDLVLNNVVASQHGNHVDDEGKTVAWYNSAVQVVSYLENGKVTRLATATINGGVYTGKNAVYMSSPGGKVVINDGVFTATDNVIVMDGNSNYAYAKHDVVINGGTFNGNIKINQTTPLTEGGTFSFVINGGTFNGDTIVYNHFDAEGKSVKETLELNFDNLSQFITAGSTVVINGETYTK